jgi:RNA polymerase sigma factor (sigma-70 family)
MQRLRTLVGARSGGDSTDSELLKRFVVQREESAFVALVERYGPLVQGVCRRVLGDAAAADDAFQATFFVLASQAGAIRKPEAIGSWLYGVALRTAQQARLRARRRREAEQRAAQASGPAGSPGDELMPEPIAANSDPTVRAVWTELRGMLDEELNRLPAKYREPIRLCYLEGKTNEEAAQVLGWPKGSVQGRLARGREMFRERLARRGVALPAVTLAALLGTQAAPAAVSAELTRMTVQGALLFATDATAAGVPAALAQEVLRHMFLHKLRTALAGGVIVLVVGGTITWSALAAAGPKLTPRPPQAAAPQRAKEPAAKVAWGEVPTKINFHPDAVAFTPDGAGLLMVRREGNAHEYRMVIQELESGNERDSWKLPFTLGYEFSNSVFSPDQKKLAVLSAQSEARIKIFDVAAKKKVFNLPRRFRPHAEMGLRKLGVPLAWEPSGKALVTADNGELVLWDTTTGKEQGKIVVREAVTAVAFSPDGKKLACAGQKTFRVYDVATRKESRSIKAAGLGSTETVFLTAEGKRLITIHNSTGLDALRSAQAGFFVKSSIRVWDVVTGKATVLWQGRNESEGAEGVLSRDDKVLAVVIASSTAAVPVPPGPGPLLPPGGRNETARSVRLYDVESGKELATIPSPKGGAIGAVNFSPDGRLLAAVFYKPEPIEGAPGATQLGVNGRVQVWERPGPARSPGEKSSLPEKSK